MQPQVFFQRREGEIYGSFTAPQIAIATGSSASKTVAPTSITPTVTTSTTQAGLTTLTINPQPTQDPLVIPLVTSPVGNTKRKGTPAHSPVSVYGTPQEHLSPVETMPKSPLAPPPESKYADLPFGPDARPLSYRSPEGPEVRPFGFRSPQDADVRPFGPNGRPLSYKSPQDADVRPSGFKTPEHRSLAHGSLSHNNVSDVIQRALERDSNLFTLHPIFTDGDESMNAMWKISSKPLLSAHKVYQLSELIDRPTIQLYMRQLQEGLTKKDAMEMTYDNTLGMIRSSVLRSTGNVSTELQYILLLILYAAQTPDEWRALAMTDHDIATGLGHALSIFGLTLDVNNQRIDWDIACNKDTASWKNSSEVERIVKLIEVLSGTMGIAHIGIEFRNWLSNIQYTC